MKGNVLIYMCKQLQTNCGDFKFKFAKTINFKTDKQILFSFNLQLFLPNNTFGGSYVYMPNHMEKLYKKT